METLPVMYQRTQIIPYKNNPFAKRNVSREGMCPHTRPAAETRHITTNHVGTALNACLIYKEPIPSRNYAADTLKSTKRILQRFGSKLLVATHRRVHAWRLHAGFSLPGASTNTHGDRTQTQCFPPEHGEIYEQLRT